jgi:hypothetical protein
MLGNSHRRGSMAVRLLLERPDSTSDGIQSLAGGRGSGVISMAFVVESIPRYIEQTEGSPCTRERKTQTVVLFKQRTEDGEKFKT